MEDLLHSLSEADRVCRKANEYFEAAGSFENEAENLNEKLKGLKKKWWRNGAIAWLIVEAIRMCVVLIPYIGKPLAILLATAGELAVIIWAVSSYKRIKKEAEASITECLNKAQNEKMKAQHYFEDHYMIIAFLPDDYWYPLATDYLIKVVSTKRATTLAEALNLFDAQLHRWKIEDINAQVLAQQQAQTAHLKSINVSSKTSAAANTAHLIFDIARKL